LQRIGFVGLGNMGLALGKGFAESGQDVAVGYFDPNVENGDLRRFASLPDLVAWAQVLFLAIKPQVCGQVCQELAPLLQEGKQLLVSIVAGVSGQRLEELLGGDSCPVARQQRYVIAMPNTPMAVRQGVCCYYCGDGVESEQVKAVHALLGSLGLAKRIRRDLMDAVPAISGSAPAYAYLLISAMGQAGVEQGFCADDAYKLAAQTVLGAAKMVLASGEHPQTLVDKVCSPGGSTIEAVLRLQEEGFATAVQKAMADCTKKIKRMKKD